MQVQFNRIYMTTVIINTRSKEAKKIVEFLKTTSYVNIPVKVYNYSGLMCTIFF